jgi:hypothetical protein
VLLSSFLYDKYTLSADKFLMTNSFLAIDIIPVESQHTSPARPFYIQDGLQVSVRKLLRDQFEVLLGSPPTVVLLLAVSLR